MSQLLVTFVKANMGPEPVGPRARRATYLHHPTGGTPGGPMTTTDEDGRRRTATDDDRRTDGRTDDDGRTDGQTTTTTDGRTTDDDDGQTDGRADGRRRRQKDGRRRRTADGRPPPLGGGPASTGSVLWRGGLFICIFNTSEPVAQSSRGQVPRCRLRLAGAFAAASPCAGPQESRFDKRKGTSKVLSMKWPRMAPRPRAERETLSQNGNGIYIYISADPL